MPWCAYTSLIGSICSFQMLAVLLPNSSVIFLPRNFIPRQEELPCSRSCFFPRAVCSQQLAQPLSVQWGRIQVIPHPGSWWCCNWLRSLLLLLNNSALFSPILCPSPPRKCWVLKHCLWKVQTEPAAEEPTAVKVHGEQKLWEMVWFSQGHPTPEGRVHSIWVAGSKFKAPSEESPSLGSFFSYIPGNSGQEYPLVCPMNSSGKRWDRQWVLVPLALPLAWWSSSEHPSW